MRCAAILLSVAVAGCTAAGGIDTKDGTPPPDAKAVILANKNRLWKDAESLRGVSITAPYRHMGFMWHVCVRANAKNGFGAYGGESEFLIAIYDDGRPPSSLMENASLNCEKLPHTPFPELEGKQAAR